MILVVMGEHALMTRFRYSGSKDLSKKTPENTQKPHILDSKDQVTLSYHQEENEIL